MNEGGHCTPPHLVRCVLRIVRSHGVEISWRLVVMRSSSSLFQDILAERGASRLQLYNIQTFDYAKSGTHSPENLNTTIPVFI